MSNKKIIIICNNIFPVPATRGGAMPNLVERLLTYNELTGKQKFIVYSIFDSRAQLRSREFRRTEFRYIHNDSICSKIRRLGWTIWNRLTQRYDGSEYIRDVVHDLKKHADPVSYVIIENAPRFSMYLRRHFPDAELILHLHNDWVNPEARYYRRIHTCPSASRLRSLSKLDVFRLFPTPVVRLKLFHTRSCSSKRNRKRLRK